MQVRNFPALVDPCWSLRGNVEAGLCTHMLFHLSQRQFCLTNPTSSAPSSHDAARSEEVIVRQCAHSICISVTLPPACSGAEGMHDLNSTGINSPTFRSCDVDCTPACVLGGGWGHWTTLDETRQSIVPHGNHEDGSYHDFDNPTCTPVPVDSAFTMARPPPYISSPYGQLPPQHVWPSMIASSSTCPSTSSSTSLSTLSKLFLPATPAPVISITPDKTPTSTKPRKSRRKLTDDDRRQVCLEAENDPDMKPIHIGGM